MYLNDDLLTVILLFCTDNKLEELQEKYSLEVEERKRLETELKVLQVKVRTLISYNGYFLVHL